MKSYPTIIFLGDGMADEPVSALGGKTPLQFARTPAMDSIARDGVCGSLLTLPDGFPTSSEVANMSVLGCDLPSEYCGRGPLEAAGRDVPLRPSDIAFRVNLVAQQDGILRDFSAGHISPQDAAGLIDALNHHFGGQQIRFFPGVSYRNILVLSGTEFSHEVTTDKPDDNHGEKIADHLPRPKNPAARETTACLNRLIREAPAVLEASPINQRLAREGHAQANGIWPWSGGKAGALKTLSAKYGITGAVISAVDVIMGLGKCLGMDIIRVHGATGYIDTNYEGKAAAAIRAAKDHDLVYLHLEAIDEVSHERDLEKKIQAIENFDSKIVGPVLVALGNKVAAAVLPDHPVPIATGKHTRKPVPVAVRLPGCHPDPVQTFDEIACPGGSLGAMRNGDFMNLLFKA